MLPIARAGREPYIEPLERFGLKIMSIGLLIAEAATVMPDPRFAGRIVSQTIMDVRWGQLDYLLDRPAARHRRAAAEPGHHRRRSTAPWS